MDEAVYLKFMKEIGQFGVKAIVLAGCGEPMLHKATLKAIEIGRKNGLDIGMFTNGALIKDEDIPILLDNLTYIRFTINGCLEESYTKIHQCRSADWQKLKANLKRCIDYKKRNNSKCTIGVYTLLLKDNVDELESWVKELKGMGLDYVIIKPPGCGVDNNRYVELLDFKEYESKLKNIAKMSDSNFTVEIRWDVFKYGYPQNYDKCLGLPFMCAVDADGSVYACNWFWGNDKFKYGNLNKNAFKEIWESERKRKIIKKVCSDTFDLKRCGACRQNSINQTLWKLANPPDHINFI